MGKLLVGCLPVYPAWLPALPELGCHLLQNFYRPFAQTAPRLADVWWVFLQPMVTGGSSVMIEVATGGSSHEQLPMVLRVPHAPLGTNPAFALLGLGESQWRARCGRAGILGCLGCGCLAAWGRQAGSMKRAGFEWVFRVLGGDGQALRYA